MQPIRPADRGTGVGRQSERYNRHNRTWRRTLPPA